jgi:hypothetical protein
LLKLNPEVNLSGYKDGGATSQRKLGILLLTGRALKPVMLLEPVMLEDDLLG